MPFESDKQRKFLFKNNPAVARRFAAHSSKNDDSEVDESPRQLSSMTQTPTPRRKRTKTKVFPPPNMPSTRYSPNVIQRRMKANGN